MANPLDSYLSGFGEIKTAFPASPAAPAAFSPADAYFDALGLPVVQKSAAPANSALAAYDEGFGKQADLLDQTPRQIAGNAYHGLTNMLSGGANAVGNAAVRGGHNFMRGLVDLGARETGIGDTLGNGLLAIPRSIGAQASTLMNGGTLGQAGEAGMQAGFAPVAASADLVARGMAAVPSTAHPASAPLAPAPAPAPPTPALATPAPATPALATPPAAPAMNAGTPPAPAPSAPAAPAAGQPPAVAGAPGPDWLDHFKKQTGSAYNPHSVVDRMKLMGMQRGLSGGQADQAASLGNRQRMNAGAGTVAGNSTILGGINASPGTVNLGVGGAPKPPGTAVAAK